LAPWLISPASAPHREQALVQSADAWLWLSFPDGLAVVLNQGRLFGELPLDPFKPIFSRALILVKLEWTPDYRLLIFIPSRIPAAFHRLEGPEGALLDGIIPQVSRNSL